MGNPHGIHRRSIAFWATILGVVCICGSMAAEWQGLSRMHFIGYDYAFFYYAFHAVLNHQGNFAHMYNLPLQQVWLRAHHFPVQPFNQYVYPPQFAVLFSFFGWLPFGLSFALWMMMTLGLYSLGIYCLMKLFWQRIRRIHVLALCSLAFTLDPFQIDLAVGNVNSMLFALIAISFYLMYRKERPGWAGVVLGIAVLIKVTPLAVLCIFVLRKQWRVCGATGMTVAGGTVLSALVVGIRPILQYAIDFSSFGHTSMKNGPAPYNQSIIGVLSMFIQHHWFHLPHFVPYAAYLLISGIALYSIYFFVAKRQLGDWRLDIALASLSVIFFSPLVEEPHLVFAVPAMIALAALSQTINQKSHNAVRLARRLQAASITSAVLLSLPVAIACNVIVGHFPQLFWIHIQMFVAMFILFSTTLTLYRGWNQRIINLPSSHTPPASSVTRTKDAAERPLSSLTGIVRRQTW